MFLSNERYYFLLVLAIIASIYSIVISIIHFNLKKEFETDKTNNYPQRYATEANSW